MKNISKEFLVKQEEACKNSHTAYWFAENKDADIEKCQEASCKDPECAYWFANDIKGADITYCQKATYKDSYWAKRFAEEIPSANKESYKIYYLL